MTKGLTNMRIRTVGHLLVAALMLVAVVVAAASITTYLLVGDVEIRWDAFEASRSEKARTLSTLWREIGYGGTIHQFKNYILRADRHHYQNALLHLGGAITAVNQYRGLGTDPAEQAALDRIEATLEEYRTAIETAERMVTQNKSAREIDRVARVDDAPALDALATLSRALSHTPGKNGHSKPDDLAEIYRTLGYGGMIHLFKNMVLRGQAERAPEVQGRIEQARKALDEYFSHDFTDREAAAGEAIRDVLDRYEKVLAVAVEQIGRDASPRAIDQLVRVDDTPALTALDTLTQELAGAEKTHATGVRDKLTVLSSVAIWTVAVTVSLLGLLAVGTLLLVNRRIIAPLTRLTAATAQLAEGDLEAAVPTRNQHKEVGDMARAMEVFRESMLRRHQAEAALEDSEQRHKAVLDTMVDAHITIDDMGIITTFNPAAEGMFGYTAEETIGQNVSILMPEPYAAEHDGYLEHYRETGERRILGIGREVVAKRKDGSVFPIDLAVAEMWLGERRFFSGILRDITERHKVDRMKNEFISTVSHELRTPLTSIRGSLGLLTGGAGGALPPAADNLIKIAHKNTERLLVLINDILDVEKIESGKMVFRFTNLQLMDFLEEAVSVNQSYAQQYGVSIDITRPVEGVRVFADPDRLMQVMSNLLSNACKFSPEGDTVEIAVARRGDDVVRISVIDHGPGIPESFHARLFGKFTQSDATDTRQVGGTGLGLSIVKAIVEKHGGQIGFVTAEGMGTTFHMDLPAVSPDLADTNAEEAPQQVTDGRHRILVIEDDPDVAAITRRILTEGGFDADIAKNAEKARERLDVAPFPYAAITLDLALDGVDGMTLYQELRSKPATADLPVVVVSASADDTRRKLNGGSIGIAEWLQKPFRDDRLLNAVRQAITNIDRPAILHVEDDPDVSRVVATLLDGYADVTTAPTLESARELLHDVTFHLVLLDVGLPDGSGLDLLPLIEEKVTPPQVIIFSAQDVAEEVAKGVSAALVKSATDNTRLLEIIRQRLQEA